MLTGLKGFIGACHRWRVGCEKINGIGEGGGVNLSVSLGPNLLSIAFKVADKTHQHLPFWQILYWQLSLYCSSHLKILFSPSSLIWQPSLLPELSIEFFKTLEPPMTSLIAIWAHSQLSPSDIHYSLTNRCKMVFFGHHHSLIVWHFFDLEALSAPFRSSLHFDSNLAHLMASPLSDVYFVFFNVVTV